MTQYFIGDIQGCYKPFKQLMDIIDFSPSRDTLFLLGDLVNRGADSALVLRQCSKWGDSVKAVLGNHDLHLLAYAHGIRKKSKRDTLDNVLEAPDKNHLLDWLQNQRLARNWRDQSNQQVLMVHAGVHPSWTLEMTMSLAQEVEQVISSPELPEFLHKMYGNYPTQWSERLTGIERLRFIVNALTRIRFCKPDGEMDFNSSESAENAPSGLIPWFECPERRTKECVVAFGHWSTLGLRNESNLMALDTGCVWGGHLTAIQVDSNLHFRRLHQIKCDAAQTPD